MSMRELYKEQHQEMIDCIMEGMLFLSDVRLTTVEYRLIKQMSDP